MLHANSAYPHPGKYEGTRYLVALCDQRIEPDDTFGDVESFGLFGSAYILNSETVFLLANESGFVSETSGEEWNLLKGQYYESLYRDDVAREAADALEKLESQESGRCDSCEVLTINGVRSHETGCPRFAKLREAREHLTRLEDF